MRITIVIAATTAGLVLTGCGGSATSGGGDSGGPGTYSAQKDSITTTIEIPTATGDATMQAILDYADAVGASTTYSFLTQTLKNESGGEVVMCDPRVVTNEGSTVTFKQVDGAISNLRNSVSGDTALYNQGVELQNSIGNSKTLPGATTTLLFIAEQEIPSIKSVTSGYTSRELMGQGCDVHMEKTADALDETSSSGQSGADAVSPSAITTSPSQMAAADLVEGFPTEDEISKVQGRTFTSKAGFPKWTQELPLTTEHATHIQFGSVQSVRPAECAALTYNLYGGFTKKAAESGIVKAAGFANNTNSDRKRGEKVYTWWTIAYLMAPGIAERWHSNSLALTETCREFKTIATNGEVTVQADESYRVKATGDALVEFPPPGDEEGTYDFYISEAIGDVLFVNRIETDYSRVESVSALYNKKANALAEIQGVSRPDIDLANLQPFTSDASKFVEIPLP